MGSLGFRHFRPERRSVPWNGFKLAYPLVSGDGARAGFGGVSIGKRLPYGIVAQAGCAQGLRHRSPSRWCDCGFYCFNDRAQARQLGCATEYQNSVVLQVAASGRYIRFEQGLRYARQRVLAAWVSRCECGRTVETLAYGGTGVVGWRCLVPLCRVCAGARPRYGLNKFGALAGIPVRTDEQANLQDPEWQTTDDQLFTLLSAEVTVLQSRLDQIQTQLDRLSDSR